MNDSSVRIKDYLWLAEKSVTDFSADVGLSPNKLLACMKRQKKWGESLAKRVERATHGYVQAVDLLKEDGVIA